MALLAVAFGGAHQPGAQAVAADEAEAAQKPPLSIGILLSSRSDVCFDPGETAAIRRFAGLERDRINAQGGIAGRQIQLEFLDDRRNAANAVANVRIALANPATLALIGLAGSDRSKAVFEAAGNEIRQSSIPFLSRIAVNSIFAGHPNVFTTQASQDDERVPYLVQFVRHNGVQRPAAIGLADMVYSTSLAGGLNSALGDMGGLAADHRLHLKDGALDPAETAAAIADLAAKKPDLLFVTVGGERTGFLLKELRAAGVTPDLFISGRIEAIPEETARLWPSDLYQLTLDRLPDIFNGRLRRRISGARPEDWVFEGSRIPEAPGWATGECKPRPEDAVPEVLSDANLRAIGIGTQYADMVALVGEAARSAPANADIPALRAHVINELRTTYAAEHGIFRGSFENWSFRPVTRAAVRTPFIVRRAPGQARTQLAPVQFVHLKSGVLRPVSTLYLDIDLIQAARVDDNGKVFFAEFYLSLRDDGKGASIGQIEFSNAAIDPQTNGRQVTVRVLNQGGRSDAYPDNMKIYHVAGKFVFQPDFANYPLDVQRFSIDIRPKSGDAPFIIQPPPHELRDRAVITDGWYPKEFYVGYEEDFISTIDARTHERSAVPFYKASFVWLMKRQITDYFLRVVVPLGFILAVAYLSIFIPLAHFEAIVTIQVTALLSAVALYLSLPKVDADSTTLSDRIFIFNYMCVSIMITISILRMNGFVVSRRWVQAALGVLHVAGIPALVTAMGYYVWQQSLAAA